MGYQSILSLWAIFVLLKLSPSSVVFFLNIIFQSKEESRRGGGDRREEDANRSFDSLDEIDAASRGVK